MANPHAKNLNPQYPKVPPLGHDPGNRVKLLFELFYISYLREHTQKSGIKIFGIDFVIVV